MKRITKIIVMLTAIIGLCTASALSLIALNIDKLTPQELQLIPAMLDLIVLEIKLLISIGLLISCLSMTWSFLPKKTDDPLIRLVKTIGILGGLFITLLFFMII